MPFSSYLCNFFPPQHHNAFRRVLADEEVDFQASRIEPEVATAAAELFLPRIASSDLHDSDNFGAPVVLHFPDDSVAGAKLESTLLTIAARSTPETRNLDVAEQGRAVLTAIADAIFPALKTGNVGRTQMARAAAMEVATAIANPRNLTIGRRAICNAVNDGANKVGCRLGQPSSSGIDIRLSKGRVTLCESNDWDRYHVLGDKAARKANAKRADKSHDKRAGNVAGRSADTNGADEPASVSHNVEWQDGKILIADVCTTFTVKTGEWWLTRKLLPRRTQSAIVGARIEMLHVQSPDKKLHEALSFENGNVRHRLANFLAFVCRFLRGVSTGKASKEEFARDLLPRRAARHESVMSNAHASLNERMMKNHQDLVDRCGVTRRSAHAQLVDEDARRVGRRSGTWGNRARYHGKVDLKVSFAQDKPVAPEHQTVSWAKPEAARQPGYMAFDTTDRAAPSVAPGGSKTASSSVKEAVPAT